MILEPGVVLNKRYTILEVIARGGMGAIYRANDESLKVEVAVKENLFTTEDFSRQFHREATILAGLRHAHLPRVTDHFVLEDRGQYLVMDYIPGQDLRHHIASAGPYEEAEALKIGLAICDAVAYLHHREPPILHRDIKPGNIKITPTGQVYLVDFGLAKVAQSGQQTTVGAQSLTPGFAPPEQYGHGTEPRSDLYALAATLYAMLTAKTPEDALSRAMGTSQLTPLRAHNPRISERTAAVVEHAMAIEPEKRYQTATEFCQALEQAAHPTSPRPYAVQQAAAASAAPYAGVSPQTRRATGPIPGATPPPPIPAAPPPAAAAPRPRRAPWLAIGIVALLVVGGITGTVFIAPLLAPRAQPTPTSTAALAAAATTPAPAPTATFTPEPAPTQAPTQPPAIPAETAVPEASPTATAPQPTPIGGGGGRIAFASKRSDSVQVWIMDLAGANAQAVTQMQDGACQPAWSPDGKRLVFVSPCKGKQEQYSGSSLFLINPDGSGMQSLATTPGGDYEPAWSPDGKQIAFTSLRDGKPHIFLYTLADDKTVRLSPQPVYDRQPAWSPDGKNIVFTTSRQGHAQVWTMAADGSNAHEFSKFDAGIASMPVWGPDGQIIYFSQGADVPGLVAKRIDDPINEFPIAPGVRPVYFARFSPDGLWMIFEGASEGKPGFFRMTPNGTNLTRITPGDTVDFQAAWQP